MHSSVDDLNQYMRVTLPNGERLEPVRMILKQIFIFKYKQFQSFEQDPYVFDLACPLTTLVGPNSSGKTVVLEIVRIFCNALMYGSGCLSPETLTGYAPWLIDSEWVNDENFHIRLQGVFDIYYSNQAIQSSSLKLNISLTSNICQKSTSMINYNGNEETTSSTGSKHVHCRVTTQPKDTDIVQWETIEQISEEGAGRFLLHTCDYSTLKNLLPKVISFNSSIVSDDFLDEFTNEHSKYHEHLKEISKEINRIFPFWKLKKVDDAVVAVLRPSASSDSNELRMFQQAANCGEGVLRCLYIIATICCAEPNSIIVIDEPDAHVFPNAQKLLINFIHRKLNEFSQRKCFCQMIITTHSADIMQAVELRNIRQIFLRPCSQIPMEIKSLSDTTQLLNAMATIGTSMLNHDDIVRLGVHRKLLYLESREDFDFISGIIQRTKPELLSLPFTIIYKGGRPKPCQITSLIPAFRHFIPKKCTLSIFVVVDSDLRCKEILERETEEYRLLEGDINLKVKVYYHCWAVREWENWLLFNEDLLCDMLFGNELRKDSGIQKLREEIQKNYRDNQQKFPPSVESQRNESLSIPIATETMSRFTSTKEDFLSWFIKELDDHREILLKDITLCTTEGTKSNDSWDSKKLAEEGKQFLRDAGIGDERMKEIFGQILVPIAQSIGAQIRKPKQRQEKQSSTRADRANHNLGAYRNNWLESRKIHEPINTEDKETREALIKWIDAKKFFYRLTNRESFENSKGDRKKPKMDLDKHWKEAFSLEAADNNFLYSRYFNSLDPTSEKKWPTDFNKFLTEFENFVTTHF